MARKTANQLLAGAAHRLGLISEDEALNADQAARGLVILNDMLNGWNADRGIQYPHGSDLRLNDYLNVPDELVRSAELLLMDDLADEYGATLTPRQEAQVLRAESALQAYYYGSVPAQTDEGVLNRRSLVGGNVSRVY